MQDLTLIVNVLVRVAIACTDVIEAVKLYCGVTRASSPPEIVGSPTIIRAAMEI